MHVLFNLNVMHVPHVILTIEIYEHKHMYVHLCSFDDDFCQNEVKITSC